MGILACHGGTHVSVGPTWAENVVGGGWWVGLDAVRKRKRGRRGKKNEN
mgnify:CR=1 FL=1